MTCSVLGERPNNFPFPFSKSCPQYISYRLRLSYTLRNLIEKGYSHFLTNMLSGAPLDFAEALHQCRVYPDMKHITIEAVMPYERQYCSTIDSDTFLYLFSKCNQITSVSQKNNQGSLKKRDQYIIDRSDLILVIWNGTPSSGVRNTLQYAIRQNKKIQYLLLGEH